MAKENGLEELDTQTAIIKKGQYVTLESLNPSHIPLLMTGIGFPENNKIVDWISGFPYIDSEEDLSNHLFGSLRAYPELNIFAIRACKPHLGLPSPPGVHPHEDALGILGYRINPQTRVIKLDDFIYSPVMQNTYAATEASYLLLCHMFEEQTIAYCRVWLVANTVNNKSRRAAERLGFVYEGTMRKENITRWGTSRDSLVMSMLDDEWLPNKEIIRKWLHVENFEADGRQIQSFDEIRKLEGNQMISSQI
ncbi:hypothetical protein ACQKWADRAFT_303676 [Trichoderma austrokoningii]